MTRSARLPRLRGDRGSATAETAIVLPVVVIMVLVLGICGAGLSTQVRLEGAARAAARELARGEDEAAAVTAARRTGGEDIQVTIAGDDPWVQVTVTRHLRVDVGTFSGAGWELSAHAQARREPHLLDGGGP